MKNLKNLDFKLGYWLFFGIIVVIFGSFFLGNIITGETNIFLSKKLAAIKESERPAELDIIILQDSTCQDCYDVGLVVQSITNENVKVNSERTVDISSDEGKEMIDKYKIEKVPTLVVTGEIEKDPTLKAGWSRIGEVRDSAFVLRQVGAPYVLTSSGEVMGRMKITFIKDSSCNECYNVNVHENILQQMGIPTENKEVVDFGVSDNQAAKELISKYQIKLIPTLILVGDTDIYPSLIKVWPQVGTVEGDGAYVFREGVKQMGTYKDLTTNKIINPKNSTQTNNSSNNIKKINVSGSEFSFSPANITVKKGETIQLTFTNNGSVSHDFVIDELGVKTRVLSPGQSQTVQFAATDSQTLSFYCSVGNHRDAGMEGKIEIQ